MSASILETPTGLKTHQLINFSKICTLTYLVGLIYIREIVSASAWVYLALYTSYVVTWLIKHFVFPNKAFEQELKLGQAIAAVPLLFGVYWVAPTAAILWNGDRELPPLLLFLSVVLFTVGLATMLIADAETYYVAMHSPEKLITTGMKRFIRHPNYVGETLVYLSYAILSQSAASFALLGCVFLMLFVPMNLRKEASLARFGEEWEHYKGRTGMYFPPLSMLDPIAVFLVGPTPMLYDQSTTADTTLEGEAAAAINFEGTSSIVDHTECISNDEDEDENEDEDEDEDESNGNGNAFEASSESAEDVADRTVEDGKDNDDERTHGWKGGPRLRRRVANGGVSEDE